MANIKNKIALPFKIVKSEVSGGFIDKVHNEFTGGVDIVNIGEDVVNNYFEANIQSPFTNQWVGGKSYRHVPLNNGQDISSNRPEAWHLDFEPTSIKFYSHAHRSSPPAYWTREEYSKRPLNIKNIGSSGSLLAGNFTENYQVLQTSGRRITNNLIVDGFEASGVLTTQFAKTVSETPIFSEDFSLLTINAQVNTSELISNSLTYTKQRVLDNPGKKYARLDGTAAGIASERFLKTVDQFTGTVKIVYTVIKNTGTTTYDPSGLALNRPEEGDDLVLQYSFDGIAWTTLKTIVSGNNSDVTGFEEKTFTDFVSFSNPFYIRFHETFVSIEGFGSDHYAITDVSFSYASAENQVYSLPELNKISGSRSVIVERFNAPGSKEESSRGALDREGEEMSPNIPLPFRNIKIRQPFYRQLAQHNPQFGSGSTYALLPDTGTVDTVTIHKVNRNRLVRGDREHFDNAFVVHAIPRNDLQYSWITASATTAPSELGGYQSFKNIDTSGSYYNRQNAFQDISFIDGTHFGYFESYLIDEFSLPILLDDGSYILINNEFTNLTLDNLYINSLTKDQKSIDLDCRTFNTTLGDVTPTYSEVTNNPYTFTTWVSIRGGQHPVTRKLRKNNYVSTTKECENFVDPAVTFKYRPLEHNVRAFGQDDVDYNILHTYTNNLSSFANKDLLTTLYLDREENDSDQFYNELYDLYVSPDGTSPITDFSSYTYSEIVWPKEENTSLAKTRKRGAYYLSVSGSSRDGYDRQLGTQRAFWRDNQQDRKRSSVDFGGYTGSIGYSSTQETGSDFAEPLPINLNFPSAGIATQYTTGFITNTNQNKGLFNSVATMESASQEIEVYQFSGSIYTSTAVNQLSVFRRKAFKFENAGEFNNNFIDTYGFNWLEGETIKHDIGSVYSNTFYKAILTSEDSGDENKTIKTDSDEIILNPKLRYTAFVGGTELNTGSYIQSNFAPNDDEPIEFAVDLFSQLIPQEDVYFSTLDYGLQRTTEQDSGKKPFFDSYDDYLEDVRSLTKEYSTIPEFKISDHMEYYSSENYRLENNKVFILDGQEVYQSSDTETGESNAQFYKSYMLSDLLKRHDKVKAENDSLAQPETISISISGIKKLLPYNGFYPQDRTVQLANIYADYIENNLAGGILYETTGSTGSLNAVLEHTSSIAETNGRSQVDIATFNDKLYAVVCHPYHTPGGGFSEVNIFSSSNVTDIYDNNNWSSSLFSTTTDPTKPEIISNVKLIAGPEKLYLFYTFSEGIADTYVKYRTSLDGITWTSPTTLYTDSMGSNFSNRYISIDAIYDGNESRFIVAAGFHRSGSSIASSCDGSSVYKGKVHVFTSDNNGEHWTTEPAIIEERESQLDAYYFGNAISLLSSSVGYKLFISSPTSCNEDTNTNSSIWESESSNGILWSIPKGIVEHDSESYLGYGGIDSVEFNDRTYVFYSTPGFGTNNRGAAYVAYSEPGSEFSEVATPIKIVEGETTDQKLAQYSNYRDAINKSISAFSSTNGIEYAIGSPFYNTDEGKIYYGKSCDGLIFETDSDLQTFQGSSSQYLGIGVSSTGINDRAVFFCSDSFSGSLIKSEESIVAIDYTSEKAQKAYKHAALEPYFAPGILYNTVKSGISVDWPCFYGTSDLVQPTSGYGYATQKYYPEPKIMSSFSGSNGVYNTRGSLRSSLNNRIKFESLLDPDLVFKFKDNTEQEVTTEGVICASDSLVSKTIIGSYIYGGYETFVNPLDVNHFYEDRPRKFGIPFVYRKTSSSSTNKLFTKAMNNFLAETSDFFLEKGKIKTLKSEPDYKWKPFVKDRIYYMDVILEKNSDLVMMESWNSDKHPTGSNGEKMNGRYFGYPVNKTTKELWIGEEFTDEESKLIHNDPAYAPYTPPYFEGNAVARLAFKATGNGHFKLDDILPQLVVKDIFQDAALGWQEGSDAQKHKMAVGSSIELFDSVSATSVDQGTDAITVKESTDSKSWVIRPKMETPVLDFSQQSLVSYEKDYIKNGGFGRGMWSGYGDIVKDGIKLKLAFPSEFTKEEQYQYGKTGDQYYSLLDHIGFEETETEIGKIAEQKEISEAIIMIPYPTTIETRNLYGTDRQYIEDLNFIKIKEDVYNFTKNNVDAGRYAVTEEDGAARTIKETSISRMIKLMKEYVIPPNLNFVEYSDLEPFIMYIFEFKHTLDQEDLKDVWQGLMPKISYTAETDTVSVQHDFTEYDLWNGAPIPDDLQWLVFKVKKKAKTDYKQMISESKGEIQVGLEKLKKPYSYNWPYDFFSLVELAKIEIDLKYRK